MGDGRLDAARSNGHRRMPAMRCSSTWMRLAQQSGSMINAVMLGAIAGIGRCRSRSRNSKRRSAPTARRWRAICAASAPGWTRRGEGATGRVRRCQDVCRRHARSARTSGRAQHAGAGAPIALEGVRRWRRIRARLTPGSISIVSSRSEPPTKRAARKAGCSRKPHDISRCACPTRMWCGWRKPRSRRSACAASRARNCASRTSHGRCTISSSPGSRNCAS